MIHSEQYELLQLRIIMKQLDINKNKLCAQCKKLPTFKDNNRCYDCVLKESSLLLHAFSNSLNLIYEFNSTITARGVTFAKVFYSSLCWCVNIANFTHYFESYGNPIHWIPELQEYVKLTHLHLDKHDKPRLSYHINNGVKEPIKENNSYYQMNEHESLQQHMDWIYMD